MTKGAIIYLRQSEFRDLDTLALDARRDELVDFAGELGVKLVPDGVMVENDIGNGRVRGASAHKTPVKVTTSTGLVTFRTRRPVYQAAVLRLQRDEAQVFIVNDSSRIARNERDGWDLLDACQVSGASAVAPLDDGSPEWLLTNGGTEEERGRFMDRIRDGRKYSEDIAAKVRKGRKRWLGKSYPGGLRPYGYAPDPDKSKEKDHKRELLIIPAEAAVLRGAADDVLKRGLALRAIARQINADGHKPVKAERWTASTLRDVLSKPGVAGLTHVKHEQASKGHRCDLLRCDNFIEAPYINEPILDRDTWERLRAKFRENKSGHTATGSEPKWLVTGFATCGVCGGTVRRGGGGEGRPPAYLGAQCSHIRRNARAVDTAVEEWAVEYLERWIPKGKLKPPPSIPAGERARLLRDKRELERDQHEQNQLRRERLIPLDELRRQLRDIADKMEAIDQRLSITDEEDPLEEFRHGKPVDQVWGALVMARKRAIVQKIIQSVVIERTVRGSHRDVRETITITER